MVCSSSASPAARKGSSRGSSSAAPWRATSRTASITVGSTGRWVHTTVDRASRSTLSITAAVREGWSACAASVSSSLVLTFSPSTFASGSTVSRQRFQGLLTTLAGSKASSSGGSACACFFPLRFKGRVPSPLRHFERDSAAPWRWMMIGTVRCSSASTKRRSATSGT